MSERLQHTRSKYPGLVGDLKQIARTASRCANTGMCSSHDMGGHTRTLFELLPVLFAASFTEYVESSGVERMHVYCSSLLLLLLLHPH